MFCYQCEQTRKAKAARPSVSAARMKTPLRFRSVDLRAEGVSQYAHRAGKLGASDPRSTLS